ncbi:LacI family DNA-binding transcriptional regulator [Arthrobacter sp. M4]|uniref:LacI family DNA-binding transcriptional regulator n=1 Tax=Arthrobacter sp. M4 TaxID=218160 RepID=UPI001CDC13C1|nr:LacI family DNA-binding transcriptional regulator [Arthrobacter sp. M4]MCA4134835.1 LacI family transcriptional regulator [Arthrobacter sp. M4]
MAAASQGDVRSVTMADVAREAGVSRQLVSLVMRDVGYVSDEKRGLVLRAAERLGYRRNVLAASLAARRTNSIGLTIFDLHNQVYADFADGVLDVIQPAGFQLLLSTNNRDRESLTAGIESLIGLRADGVLLATHIPDQLDLARLLAGTPTVTIGEDPRIDRVDAVHGDDRLGSYQATKHLIGQGHRDIVYIAGPATQQNTARRAGYAEAMSEESLPTRVVDGDASETGGERALLKMRRSGMLPTAVLCYNDSTAIGALTCAQRERLRVPHDLAVVGYDNTRPAAYPGVDLTSVDPQARAMGANAAALLLDRIADPTLADQTLTLAPQLIIRGSSSFYRGR